MEKRTSLGFPSVDLSALAFLFEDARLTLLKLLSLVLAQKGQG